MTRTITATEDTAQSLRSARRALLRAYALHVAWFAGMCAFAATHWNDDGLRIAVLLTLLTVPPVLRRTVRVHRLCRAIDPQARTLGRGPVLLITLVLRPFESGLVLPLKNLWACRRLLRAIDASQQVTLDRPCDTHEGDTPGCRGRPDGTPPLDAPPGP
ncbi:hypothetical protein [Luteimonas sp. TWI662]|uniref:hypothetical protein n=1 Tax=unclassified Luteimonas TaxID=2629088 RepID=UPI00320A8D7C